MTEIDCYRTLVFPNRIRKFRKQLNIGSLLELSERLPTITYIRLSKIERGEIFARADELRALGKALGVEPDDLLVDVDDPAFDIAAWAEPLHGAAPADAEGELGAVLLAAALRARRGGDAALTIAVLEQDYGIAPVVLSRIENALKPLDRWNEDVRAALRRLFGAASDAALVAQVEAMHARGDLDPVLPLVANPEIRLAKSRARIAALREELAVPASAAPIPEKAAPLAETAAEEPAETEAGTARIRLLPVFGTALPEGLIAQTPTGAVVEAPRGAGPRAYGLRLSRPTLGAGLPGRATLVVDPDRYPATGGLAVIREEGGLRVLSVAADRHGRMQGYSMSPDLEVAIDALDPSTVAAVLSAVFE
ncbi:MULTISPECIES: helix-turn-helix transcriptional regulator [unclassified Novosphingobium]|uniref:helix-turn-helix domain-containing protein n=1 Tax=unclassified Novosphingobium TaxID=2644732 RepID=UPI001F1A0A0C|nr:MULTISPECIES: helix-turn-helix transcriptional regulator [unclassified Novosphingobium]